MTHEQRERIAAILIDRGLTFAPLQDDMIDHIGCDVELLMDSGKSFEEALHETLDDIPGDHFVAVQREVLIGIDKRFAASKWLSYLTIAALLLGVFFKVFHLQFSDEILIASFILIGSTLLRGSFFGASMKGKPKGTTLLLFTLSGLIILLTGYAFRILHLSGADTIITVAGAVNVVALLINTYTFFQFPPGRETMLTFLHEKYTPDVERFLLILLFFITAIKIVGVVMVFHLPFTTVILLIVIFGGGLHLITMAWSILQQQVIFKRPIFLVSLVITSISLPLPFLGEILPWEIRIVSVTAFVLVSAFLAHSMQQQAATFFSTTLTGFPSLLFLMWAMLRLGVLPLDFSHYLFNLPVLILMVVGLLISEKHGTIRSFMIIALAGYLLEYQL